jgi:hypothetical protein
MIYRVILPALLLVMPWVLVRYVFKTSQTKNQKYTEHAKYVWLAVGAWLLSQLLPRVSIAGQTDTFIMHMLGGVVAALLFVYAVKSYGIKFEANWQPWVALFLFASGLGVFNELFEFLINALGLPDVVGGDEWWDLTANTLGSLAGYGAIVLAAKINK